MKRESYLKLKSQKRKAKLLAILTTLSLLGCSNKEVSEIAYTETESLEGHIEIVYSNGVLYPSRIDDFSETEYDAFARMSIPVFNSYKRDKEVIGVISEYQTMDRIYSNGEYSYVTTLDGISGYVIDELITVLPDNYIEVDLSSQKVKVVNNGEIVLYADVVTGKPGTETDIGYTEVLSKTYNRPLIGPGYRLDVQYFIHFNTSEEGFHDNHNRYAFGGDIYQTNGSHGCVNMALEDVKIMDENCEVGTKVLVHK